MPDSAMTLIAKRRRVPDGRTLQAQTLLVYIVISKRQSLPREFSFLIGIKCLCYLAVCIVQSLADNQTGIKFPWYVLSLTRHEGLVTHPASSDIAAIISRFPELTLAFVY